jgi:hypothetical protein
MENGGKKQQVRYEASSEVQMRYALFWDFMQCDWWLVADVSEQSIGPIFKGQAIQDQSTLCKISEEDKSQESSYFVIGKKTMTMFFVCYHTAHHNGKIYV